MSIATKLMQLNEIRTDIMESLIEKGADVNASDGLSVVSDAIDSLQTGSDSKVEKVNYSFGLLSDVHLRDTEYGSDIFNSVADLQKALTFYNNAGCKFLSVCGDIVFLGSGSLPSTEEECKAEWLSEVELFKSMCNTYFPNKEVYVCAGNHDANPKGGAEQLSSLSGLTVNITKEGVTKTAKTWWESIFDTTLNHVVTHTENDSLGLDDVFIFFSMKYWNYVDPVYTSDEKVAVTGGFTEKTDLDWLAEQLETYKDKRVLLFFHLPLTNTDFIAPTTNGLISAQSNVHLWNRGIFGRLMLAYPNVIWINGHSHYKLNYEGLSFEYDDEYQEPETILFQHPNIYQPEVWPLMVHCSSCAYPRIVNYKKRDPTTHEWDGTWAYTNDNNGSQGYIVDVYDDRIVLRGIDFTQGSEGRVIPNAVYCINTK